MKAKKKMVSEWLLYALLASLCIALANFITSKVSKDLLKKPEIVSQLVPIGAIMLAAGVVAYFLFYYTQGNKDVFLLIAALLVISLATFAFNAAAFTTGKTGLVGAVLNLNVIMVVILAYFFYGEKLSWKEGLGILLALLSVWIIAF